MAIIILDNLKLELN